MRCGLLDAPVYHSVFHRHFRIEKREVFSPDQVHQTARFRIADRKHDLDRKIAGKLEEMLFMDHAEPSKPGNRTEDGAAVNSDAFRLLQQPFVEQNGVMSSILVDVEFQVGSGHSYTSSRLD